VTSALIRTIQADEFEAWIRVVRAALLGPPPDAELVAHRSKIWDLDRCHAAFDHEGHIGGAARAFPTELTVPGGTVAAAAVTSVGVLPTHRRQGYLTGMMHAQLDDIADRGESVAVLVAAEYPIYGRFGYGPATEACAVHIDIPGPDGWRDDPTGSVSLVDNDTFLSALLELYERARQRAAGHIIHDPEQWEALVGMQSWIEDHQRRADAPKVLWQDDAGQVQAAAMYTVKEAWDRNRPRGVLSDEVLVATSDAAERNIIHYLAGVDWVTTLQLGLRPVDHPLSLWLRNGRDAVMVDRSDHLWARILDVRAALSGRRYGSEGQLILEVDDPLGYASGRFRLAAGPGGAACQATSTEPDLVVPVSSLGAAYLGGISWGRLAAAGWVEERRPGAVDHATALFSTPRAPWCGMTF
jgi:predicted acetyltransferase